VIKEGVHADHDNKDKLLDLLRFQSSAGANKDDLTSLKQYVGRMRDGQKHIYYIAGENRELVEKSPHLEIFRDKSIEVLYLVDPIDEFIIPTIYNYENKPLQSITKGDLDLGDLADKDQKQAKKAESTFKKLAERIKNILSDSVKEVRVTTRLTDSPCCLVADEHDMSPHMEKVMKAMGQTVPVSKRTLEINADHAILVNMNAIYERTPTDPLLDEWSRLLFDQAMLAEGQMVADPRAYARRVNDLLIQVSGDAAAKSAVSA
jgi:molecular chaperone HtpG